MAILHSSQQIGGEAVEGDGGAAAFGVDGDFADQVAGFEAQEQGLEVLGFEVAVAAE
ncbi:hypothetical protein [Leptolyngbya sp. FACHB-261]|uniref:hypothetical protein n=1 Tax=Leptolyngbya sp. FACHB-261 TaxID=2692806 RepID=UPI0016866C7E|nr:hypothetical protein [Leptolyngbya sp. FACHB-261]MBD2100377.1 hypothetical protein [Leptolyngbya sp. FACHB-261]